VKRFTLIVSQKSAEGKVDPAVGKASEALEQPTRLQILKGESPFSVNCLCGRIAYPERAEATKHDMPGCKSLGCPVGKLAVVGAIGEASKLGGLNITKCLQPRKIARGKVAFAEQTGSRPFSAFGKADDLEEETGKSTRGDRRGRGPGIWGKICRIESGRCRWQQGLAATCRDSWNEVNNRRTGEPTGLAHESIGVYPKNLVAFDFWCAVKSAGLLRVQVPPESWFAPLGSNRSGGGGNETAGASGVEGRYGDLASMQAVT